MKFQENLWKMAEESVWYYLKKKYRRCHYLNQFDSMDLAVGNLQYEVKGSKRFKFHIRTSQLSIKYLIVFVDFNSFRMVVLNLRNFCRRLGKEYKVKLRTNNTIYTYSRKDLYLPKSLFYGKNSIQLKVIRNYPNHRICSCGKPFRSWNLPRACYLANHRIVRKEINIKKFY